MSGDGWFKIHRDMFESDIWADVTTFRLFIYLIGKASHQDGFKYRGMILNKGQWIRSYRKLADDLSYKEGRGFKKYSLSTIKRCVNKLIESERVNVNETELGTLFTIVNYAKYQHYDENENETPNGLNDEVRTNAELMQNEDGTNAEQDQELKNLRTKEFKRTTTTGENNFGEMLQSFEENLCKLSTMQIDSFGMWYDDFKQNDEIITEAIKIAADRDRRNFGFVEMLFREWAGKNLESIDQVRSYERNKFNNRQSNFRPNKPTEVVPEWFDERKKHEDQPDQTESVSKEEVDEMMRRLAGE